MAIAFVLGRRLGSRSGGAGEPQGVRPNEGIVVMAEALPPARTWADLSIREREQIGLILFSLKEFSFGYTQGYLASFSAQPGSAAMRFYLSSLYHYCCNYFLVGGANKLSNVLVALGSGDLLEEVNAILAKPLGSTNFGEVLRTFRDKWLTHSTFTNDAVEKHLGSKLDMDDPSIAAEYGTAVDELLGATERLYLAIAGRFPEAFGSN